MKPAVVSVRVKVENAMSNDGLPSQLENVPPQMREFFRRFGENPGDDRRGRPAAPRVPAGRASAPAS